MNSLMRFDPFRELQTLHEAMDELFESRFPRKTTGWSRAWNLDLDLVEKDDEFVVQASIPGIDPEDMEIVYTNGMLTLKGEVKETKETEEGQYHMRERRFGEFRRSLSLPTAVDDDNIEASYHNGILTLRLPKAEEAKPRRIPVQTNGQVLIEG